MSRIFVLKEDERLQSNVTSNKNAYLFIGQQTFDIRYASMDFYIWSNL